ncbi:hypothetical protein K8Z61_07685 [Nocardioides sp. TRM66260-LWL]|uniref:hypothetical protein n=1 Tax=Nocardioides sp. TRM66260-LWL TaxID=2874478 RepID=UPI001CC62DB1|nr:hypothetical protein [Nocardioides sp. TRM66260-LWL]MBZ5734375.1 hypothetical protein [Nocardioides sp. TRM66260-LWL]
MPAQPAPHTPSVRLRRGVLAAGLALSAAAGLSAAGLPAATAAPVPTITLSPRSAPASEPIAQPYLVGRTVHDGDVTAVAPARALQLLGEVGDSYAVRVSVDGKERVAKVRPGRAAIYLTGSLSRDDDVTLGRDGSRLTISTYRSVETGTRTTLTVLDTGGSDGRASELGRRTFDGYAQPLDASGDRAIVASSTRRHAATLEWRPAADTVRQLVGRYGYVADLAANRLGVYEDVRTDAPCSRISTLSLASRVLSRSCTWQASSFSPDGSLMAQIPVLSDGPGPLETRVATIAGTPLADYRASKQTVSIGVVRWLEGRRVLLRVASESSAAYVACVRADCGRVSPIFSADQGS